MNRRKLRRKRILFSLLLLFSFIFGLFPGASRATDAEVRDRDDVMVITENVEEEVAVEEMVPVEEEIGVEDGVGLEENEPVEVEIGEIEEEDVKEKSEIDEPKAEEPKAQEPNAEETRVEEPNTEEVVKDEDELKEQSAPGVGLDGYIDIFSNVPDYADYSVAEPKKSALRGSNSPISLGFETMAIVSPTTSGQVTIDKEAAPVPGLVNTWDITLRIEGFDSEKSSDIVLLIDRSGSMVVNGSQRLNKAKAAAIKFVNAVADKPNTRIAIVSYSSSGYTMVATNQNFTSDKTLLKDAINGLNGNGGTNTQAGIDRAAELLKAPNSVADLKNIVLLSDGDPTQSFAIKNVKSKLISFNEYRTAEWNGSNYNFTLGHVTRDNLIKSDFDYSSTFGYGTQAYTRLSRYSNDAYSHGNSAIAEASIFKNTQEANTQRNIWTIGLETSTYGSEVLTAIASDPQKFYEAGEDDLGPIFTTIAGSLNSAAKAGKVVDPMGNGFQIHADDVNKVTKTQGTVTYDAINKILYWNVGDLNTPISTGSNIKYAELKYRVEINDDILQATNVGGLYDTNGNATFKYTDANGIPNTTLTFPKPKVNPIFLKVKKILKNSKGVVITDEERTFPINIKSDPNTAVPTNPMFSYTEYNNTYNLKPNQEVTKTNLRLADTYTVSENAPDYVTEIKVNNVVTSTFTVIGPSGGNDSNQNDILVEVTNTLKVGALSIKKTKDDGITPIDTAKFKLFKDNILIQEVETVNGMAEFTNLKLGTYTLIESQAPVGYALSQNEYQVMVSLDANNNIVVTVKSNNQTLSSNPLVIVNKALGSIQIGKIDSFTEEYLPGAEFDLYQKVNIETPGAIEFTMLDGTKIYGIKMNTESLITDVNGETEKVEGLLLGTYFIVETKAPDGYFILDEPIIVEITGDNQEVYKFIENTQAPLIPMTGGVGTMIFSIIGLTLMGGALLGYKKNQNKNKGERIMKNKKLFTLLFSALFLFTFMGPIAAKATVGNPDTRIKPELTKVTIHKLELDAKLNSLVNHDGRALTPAQLEAKLGTTNYQFLDGVEFTYWVVTDGKNAEDLKGKTIAELNALYTTKKTLAKTVDGKVTFNLPTGNYYFRETARPSVVTDTQGVPFMLGLPVMNAERTGYINDLHIYPKNVTVRGAVILTKTAGQSLLKGATFRLFNSNDTEFVRDGVSEGTLFVTDDTGRIYVNNLPKGNYYFKEISAPTGYLLDSSKIPFTIAEDGEVILNGNELVSTGTVKNVGLENFTEPEVEKSIDDQETVEDSADFGEVKTYFINMTLPKNIATYSILNLKDTIDSRLDYVGNLTVESSSDGTTFSTLAATAFTAVAPTASSRELTINFKPAQLEEIVAIRVSFDAKINATAEMSTAIPNKATLTFNNSFITTKEKETNETRLFTGGKIFVKIDGATSSEAPVVLEGAEFAVKNGEGKFLKVDNGVYSWVANLADTSFRITSGDDGRFEIKGLSYDLTIGTKYYLYETKAPMGPDGYPYNLIDADIEFLVNGSSYYENASDFVKANPLAIKNSLGPRIPQTGGIGTILFTILGSGLMGSALLLNRKRKTN